MTEVTPMRVKKFSNAMFALERKRQRAMREHVKVQQQLKRMLPHPADRNLLQQHVKRWEESGVWKKPC